MSFSELVIFIRDHFVIVPWGHWVIISVLALTACLWVGKKNSIYCGIAFGVTVFIALFLLETAIVIRCCDLVSYTSGFDFAAERKRFFHGTVYDWRQILLNIVVFAPFGFFLSEFLASAKWFSTGRRLGHVVLAGFALSLCIECLQLVLRVGIFELTDLVMNTLGAFVGAGMAVGLRLLWMRGKRREMELH